jgi:hypothetical protein
VSRIPWFTGFIPENKSNEVYVMHILQLLLLCGVFINNCRKAQKDEIVLGLIYTIAMYYRAFGSCVIKSTNTHVPNMFHRVINYQHVSISFVTTIGNITRVLRI